MSAPAPAIHWFRRDLRLADNPALAQAARAGKVLAVFIVDPDQPGEIAPGAAGRAWLHRALAALDDRLRGALNCYRGRPQELLPALAARWGARLVTWGRLPDPSLAGRDEAVAEALRTAGCEVHAENGFLLWEPEATRKPDGTPYRVFTPFYQKGCLAVAPPRRPQPAPRFEALRDREALPLAALGLWPAHPWAERVMAHWQVGERAAEARLARFVAEKLAAYPARRDLPGEDGTSRLSPHLHFGELSPNAAWHAATGTGADEFRTELAWREFSWSLLVHNPDLAERPLRPEFDRFPWRDDEASFAAWRRGRTGIPLVDAGMRELWQTGWMHNRVRMVTASFLVKNLLIDWRAGERWFRDCLVDADPANNAAGWQWVAGCGADAAPYFRIFNPVLQGEKFDPAGTYVRRFVPEIARLPDRWLHRPWEAPGEVLEAAGVRIGRDYPAPIVDLAVSRRRALAAYDRVKRKT
ncbi:MAG: deoxyribodipyrimidine photo-lyase [Porticoccaceae bacterium]|nr:MAG: deoxyribodipyrimidine photo-lyase [Porticoccaceae bacterium]